MIIDIIQIIILVILVLEVSSIKDQIKTVNKILIKTLNNNTNQKN